MSKKSIYLHNNIVKCNFLLKEKFKGFLTFIWFFEIFIVFN